MTSIKLTKQLRQDITHDLVQHKFKVPIYNMMIAWRDFAGDVYDDIYSEDVRSRMHKLPNGWLTLRNSVCVQFGPGTGLAHLALNGRFMLPRGLSIGSATLMPERDPLQRRFLSKDTKGCAKVYHPKDGLTLRHGFLRSNQSEITNELSKADSALRIMLATVKTTSALVREWPEVEPFLKKWEAMPKNLPALPIVRLNEMLNL